MIVGRTITVWEVIWRIEVNSDNYCKDERSIALWGAIENQKYFAFWGATIIFSLTVQYIFNNHLAFCVIKNHNAFLVNKNDGKVWYCKKNTNIYCDYISTLIEMNWSKNKRAFKKLFYLL